MGRGGGHHCAYPQDKAVYTRCITEVHLKPRETITWHNRNRTTRLLYSNLPATAQFYMIPYHFTAKNTAVQQGEAGAETVHMAEERCIHISYRSSMNENK